MSKISSKQRYEAFTEWHNWAKSVYPSYKTKKKKVAQPKFSSYGK